MYSEIFSHEWKAFTRNKLQLGFYIVLLLAGLYAIHYGNKVIHTQRGVLSTVREEEKAQFVKLLKGFDADTATPMGKISRREIEDPHYSWAFHKYSAYFEPSAMAGLSIGQRDVFPYYHKLNSHSLYMQVFKNEIVNPEKLLTGNLDLSFVFIFLFPLFIIAMGYGMVSAEKENGTYAVLKTQSIAFSKLIIAKLFFRLVLVAAAAVLLSATGMIINHVPLGWAVAAWILAALLYMLFWMAISYWIASLQKNSAFNAMSLLTAWLLLLVVLPSLLNAVVVYRYPINQTNLTNVIRRIQVDGTTNNLYKLTRTYYDKHPEFDDHDTSAQNIFRKVYIIAGEMGDETAEPQVRTYYKQIAARNEWVSRFNIISPAVTAQQMFNWLACTDMTNYLHYQEAVTDFHRQLVGFYHTPLFKNRLFTKDDYRTKPSFQWSAGIAKMDFIKGVLLLLLWVLILLVNGYRRFRRAD